MGKVCDYILRVCLDLTPAPPKGQAALHVSPPKPMRGNLNEIHYMNAHASFSGPISQSSTSRWYSFQLRLLVQTRRPNAKQLRSVGGHCCLQFLLLLLYLLPDIGAKIEEKKRAYVGRSRSPVSKRNSRFGRMV